jgi:hypothetical protein
MIIGDGMFFQLVICVSIWVVGLIINVIRNFPYFYAFPLLSKNSKLILTKKKRLKNYFIIKGGFLWSTANICTVPIIKYFNLIHLKNTLKFDSTIISRDQDISFHFSSLIHSLK